MDAWIIQSKHAMEGEKLKHNYLSSLKSMSKTISPFLIILTMIHNLRWNLWVVQRLYSPLEMWFEFLWYRPFSPIYTWLENIYICIYTDLWDGRVPVLMDLECSGTLGFISVSSFLVEACWKVKTASVVLSYSTTQ